MRKKQTVIVIQPETLRRLQDKRDAAGLRSYDVVIRQALDAQEQQALPDKAQRPTTAAEPCAQAAP